MVCADPLTSRAISPCGHSSVCVLCTARLRILLGQRRCIICKAAVEFVVGVGGALAATAHPRSFASFETYGEACGPDLKLDHASGVFFHSSSGALHAELLALRTHGCGLGGAGECSHPFPTLPALGAHLRAKHGCGVCELCAEHTTAFFMELPRYKLGAELGAHVSATHPACKFCSSRFYSDADLFRHLERDHFSCGFCMRAAPAGHREYFAKYENLERHWRSRHHPCEVESCRTKRFIVFDSLLELQAHQSGEHGATVDVMGALGFRFRNTGGGGPARPSQEPRFAATDGEWEESPGGAGSPGGVETHMVLTPEDFPSLRLATANEAASAGELAGFTPGTQRASRFLEAVSARAFADENFPSLVPGGRREGGGGGGGGDAPRSKNTLASRLSSMHAAPLRVAPKSAPPPPPASSPPPPATVRLQQLLGEFAFDDFRTLSTKFREGTLRATEYVEGAVQVFTSAPRDVAACVSAFIALVSAFPDGEKRAELLSLIERASPPPRSGGAGSGAGSGGGGGGGGSGAGSSASPASWPALAPSQSGRKMAAEAFPLRAAGKAGGAAAAASAAAALYRESAASAGGPDGGWFTTGTPSAAPAPAPAPRPTPRSLTSNDFPSLGPPPKKAEKDLDLQFRLKLARERDVVPTRKGGGASLDALIGAQSSGTVRNPAGMLWQTGAQRLEAPVRASAPAAPSKATDLDDDLAALGKGLGKIKVRPSKD